MSTATDRLEGQTAIVTGASAGIGAATGHELSGKGANVVLAARSPDRLVEFAADLKAAVGGVRLAEVCTRTDGHAELIGSVSRSLDPFQYHET